MEVLEGEVVTPLQYPTGPRSPASHFWPTGATADSVIMPPVPTHAPHFTSTVTASSGLPEPWGETQEARAAGQVPKRWSR